MARSGENLGSRKRAAILALLSSRSIQDAAHTANVPLRTLHRWLSDPDFDAEYQRAKRTVFAQAVGQLQQGATVAAATMMEIVSDTRVSPSVRWRVADCVLTHAAKAVEHRNETTRPQEDPGIVQLLRAIAASPHDPNDPDATDPDIPGNPPVRYGDGES